MLDNIIDIASNRGANTLFTACLNGLKVETAKLFNKKEVIKNIYNYKMYLDLYDRGISRTLLLFGNRELEHKYMLEKILTKNMNIYDIGANIGYYLLMEHKLIGPNGKIVAVEPSPQNVKLLKKNIKLNNCNNAQILQLAISDKKENKIFHLATQSNLNTFHNTGTGTKHLSGKVVNVETETVPGLVIRTGVKPDLIRMDVEGHEVEIFNGMIPSIEKNEIRPKIIFETHLTRYTQNHCIKDPLKKLTKLGYQFSLVGSSSERGSKIIDSLGYKSCKTIKSDGVTRKIYENIKAEHAIDLISTKGGIRTVLLS